MDNKRGNNFLSIRSLHGNHAHKQGASGCCWGIYSPTGLLGNKMRIVEKSKIHEEKRGESNKVFFLVCKDCWKESQHSLSIPHGHEIPAEPFDFCHFCDDCNSFRPLTSLILKDENRD